MILMRHGQTMFNVIYGETRQDPGIEDPPLTDVGREQAEDVARRLAGESVSRIISSPYTRALQTAEIVAGHLGVPVTVEADVRERTAFACDIGTEAARLAEHWPRLDFGHIDHVWWNETEETVPAFHDRCARFRRTAAMTDDWQDVAIVTHWGVIRSLTGERVGNADTVRCDPTMPHPPLETTWP